MIPPFALHVSRAFEAGDKLWLEGPACGRVPEPGDELLVQSLLSPPIPTRVTARAGNARGSKSAHLSIGLAQVPGLSAGRYVGAHLTEEGPAPVPFSADLVKPVRRGTSVVKLKVGNHTKWGFAEIRGNVVVFHVIGGLRLGPTFWSEFHECIFDEETDPLTHRDVSPIGGTPVLALQVLERNEHAAFVRPVGPVLSSEAWLVTTGGLDLVPVYQQPTGPIQFRVSNSAAIDHILLAA